MPTREDYEAAFAKEKLSNYPLIDMFEREYGYAIDRSRLNSAARILACPVKANLPNWQHGRVIYAVARKLLETEPDGIWLDIGTAKGFSAVIMAMAQADVLGLNPIVSLDVIDPNARARRNTIAETCGYLTLSETVAGFIPDGYEISFYGIPSLQWFEQQESYNRTSLAFVDGRHTYEIVKKEIRHISSRQEPGDVIIFDDIQVAGVHRAVMGINDYDVRLVWALSNRGYAIATRQ